MQIFGHRGACGYKPENTLTSFEKALEMGVEMIEVDIHKIKTGELIAIHDDKVDRTTNGMGYVTDFSFDELRRLDAGNGERIPLLSEVLNLVNKKVPVNIELKGAGTAVSVAELIMQYTSEKGWTDDLFMISSYNHIELDVFMKLAPSIRTGALISGIPIDYAAFAEKVGAYSANLDIDFISREYIDDAHARGLKVFVYTVNDMREVKRMQSFNVDGIFTNYPDRAFSYLS